MDTAGRQDTEPGDKKQSAAQSSQQLAAAEVPLGSGHEAPSQAHKSRQ